MLFQGKIMLGDSFMVTIDNQIYQVSQDKVGYNKLFAAFKADDADEFMRLYTTQESLEAYVQSSCGCCVGHDVVVKGEQVFYNGIELNNAIVDTIRTMMNNDLDFSYMVNFLRRALQSGSRRVLNELFTFLQACGLTITPDGCFLAYKTVRYDYLDKHSRTIDNSVGTVIPRMERVMVDDDCNNLCSRGYHVGALAYAGPGGTFNDESDHVMIVKVAPEDVVSVPVDYNGQKLRCCWYEVVGEYKAPLKSTVYHGKHYDEAMEATVAANILDPEEMVVDGMYEAYYTNRNGETKFRYFVVLEAHDDHVVIELMEPEDHYGDVRRMNFDSFGDIFSWDGCPPDDDDDDDDYDDDDEDTEAEDCDCSPSELW